MKGLDLAYQYYDTYIDQLLEAVPQARGRIAAGLVGEGSQCFGFDDEISQDHDFAPGFCIWLTDEDFDAFGEKLQQAYDALPNQFDGYDRSNIIAEDRLGVMKIGDFYSRYTGSADGIPKTNVDWLFTPEYRLAAATNGKVFQDDLGLFTEIRLQLLKFYPEDVRRKKIAARAAIMSQAGQYNLLRCIKRQEKTAALLSMARFIESTISMAHLLNKRYTPFYKWAHRSLSMQEHPLCPLIDKLDGIISLLQNDDFDKAHRLAYDLTESICIATAAQLRKQGISTAQSDFLQDHLPEIMAGIRDPQLRQLPPMLDCQN